MSAVQSIDIRSIEGKWKLSQNHKRQRRERVIDALTEANDPNSTAIAELMGRLAERPSIARVTAEAAG